MAQSRAEIVVEGAVDAAAVVSQTRHLVAKGAKQRQSGRRDVQRET